MHKILKYSLVVCLLGSLSADEGLQYLSNLINEFERLRSGLVKDFSKENRVAVVKEAKDLAQKTLDVQEIGKLALGSHYRKLKEKEREEFLSLFHELMANRVVEANIPSQKIVSKKIPIEIKSEAKIRDKLFQKDAIVVKTLVPHQKLVYDVDFYLYKKDGELRLYDVHVDKASTLNDFRNQFSSIIRKKGIKYLITRLRTRIHELNKPSNKDNQP